MTFDYLEPYPSAGDGDGATNRRGGSLARPCHADGSSMEGNFPLPVPNTIGAAASGVIVVATPAGLQGFRA